MNEFMKMVRDYAASLKIEPSTVAQRAAGVGGGSWSRWEAGTSSPTMAVADRIKAYIAENPAPVAENATGNGPVDQVA